MNYKRLFSLSIGILVTVLPLNQANALTVKFEREYDEGFFEGKFIATDDNNDQVISANEVTLFEATVYDNNGMTAQMSPNEGKSIFVFNYSIGTNSNNLAFFVTTTDRNDSFPFGSNIGFDIDFTRFEDYFLDSDVFSPMFDNESRGRVEVLSDNNPNTQVPEPTSIIALLVLGGFGVVSRLR